MVITDSLSRADPGAIPLRLAELDVARAAHADRYFAVLARTSGEVSEQWSEAIRDRHLGFLHGYGRGVRALGRLAEYSRSFHREDRGENQAIGVPFPAADHGPAGRVLDEVESKRILAAAGIPTVETVLAMNADDAAREAARLGYPVALKVSAPEIVHKSDQGGVLLGLKDEGAARDGFATLQEVAASAGATFRGVAVQSMAAPGLEIILGANRDPQFGPLIAFGLGGVLVEILKDVALRFAPLSDRDARAMLDEIRARQLLEGVRGRPGVDRAAIESALVRLADLMVSRPDIVSIDVNPAFAYPSGLVAVDARIQLTPDQ
jgi:acyl-CoA synthetase (NDP forming)